MRHWFTAAAAVLLASCGGQSEGGNGQAGATAGSGAGEAGGGEAMQAGLWETTVQVAAAEVPNLPAGVNVPAQTFTARTCLTQDQVARPGAEIFGGSAQAEGCTYENFSAQGGRIRGTATCTVQGLTSRVTMDGRFGATSYEMTQRSEVDMGGTATTSETRITGRRVGDCPG